MKCTLHVLIASFAISGLLVSCGGGTLSGEGASDKKKEKIQSGDEDQMASDPQVVTGAYLACEISTTDVAAGKDSVGCSIMSNNRQVIAGPSEKLEFAAEFGGASKNPDQLNSKSGYQALFQSPPPETRQTKYIGRIFSSGTLARTLECYGDKLPCVAPVTPMGSLSQLKLTTLGLWVADGSFNNAASKAAFKPACPNNPDYYCDGSGKLTTVSPSSKINKDTKDNCISTGQSVLNTIIKVGTVGMFDPMKMFDEVPVPRASIEINKGKMCAVRKIPRTGLPAKYVNEGSGCYVAMISQGGKAMNIIMSKSDVKDPAAMEQQLAQFACPP